MELAKLADRKVAPGGHGPGRGGAPAAAAEEAPPPPPPPAPPPQAQAEYPPAEDDDELDVVLAEPEQDAGSDVRPGALGHCVAFVDV